MDEAGRRSTPSCDKSQQPRKAWEKRRRMDASLSQSPSQTFVTYHDPSIESGRVVSDSVADRRSSVLWCDGRRRVCVVSRLASAISRLSCPLKFLRPCAAFVLRVLPRELFSCLLLSLACGLQSRAGRCSRGRLRINGEGKGSYRGNSFRKEVQSDKAKADTKRGASGVRH